MGSGYQLQTGGQTERVIQTLEVEVEAWLLGEVAWLFYTLELHIS